MHYNQLLYRSMILIFLASAILYIAPVHAAGGYSVVTPPVSQNVTSTGGYVVTSAPLSDNFTDSSGADGTWSFWEVPLWMQIVSIFPITAGFFILLKMSPLFLGKIVEALNNINRKKVYKYVQDHPGSTVSDVSRDEELNIGTVRYHIRVLEAAHKISIKRFNKFVRIFQNSDHFDEKEKNILSSLANPINKSIIEMLMDNPGSTNRQISDALKISESRSHPRLKNMVNENIIEYRIEETFKKYYIKDDCKDTIEKFLK